MKALQLSEIVRNDAFHSGILDNKPVQVSHRGKTGWHLYKGYLQEGNLNDGIQLAELTPTFGEGETYSGEIGISFRIGHRKMVCHTAGHLPHIDWPNNLTAIQRRAFKRQNPLGYLSMWMWPSNKRTHDHVLNAEVLNMSSGGIQIFMPEKELEDCYYCVINSKPRITSDALVRTTEPAQNGHIIVSMQFVGLELDPSIVVLKKLVLLMSRYARKAQQTFNETLKRNDNFILDI